MIEHGVDLTTFFAEVSRLLKANGLLFITTDYWEEPFEIESFIKPFALDWKVFCRVDIEEIISLAQANNLILEDKNIPACADKPIVWYNYQYTFIALLFRKVVDR